MAANSKVVDMKQGKKPLMVMTITTEIARSWLEVNIHNRPVNDNTIRRYVGNSGKFGTEHSFSISVYQK